MLGIQGIRCLQQNMTRILNGRVQVGEISMASGSSNAR